MHVSITYHYQNNIIAEASVLCEFEEQVSLDCSAETKTSSSSTSSLTFCHSRMWCALLLLLCLAMANKRTGRHQIALTIQMCNLRRLTSSPDSGLRWQTMTSTIWCVWQLFIVPQTERKLLQTDRCLCWICWPPQWMPLTMSLYCNYASNPYGSCKHHFCWLIPPLATWCPSNFGAKQTSCHV